MTQKRKEVAAAMSNKALRDVRVTGGPGGIRAISADLVFMMLWERFPELGGVESITQLEAVSGASIPFVFWRSGLSASAVQHLHVTLNYLKVLDFTSKLSTVVVHHWRQMRRFRNVRPMRGRINPTKFVNFIEEFVRKDETGKPIFPAGYTCVACCEDDKTGTEYQVVFTKDATYLRDSAGKVEVNEPVRIGLAVAAGCAVPLGFDPIELTLSSGRTIYAFDGAMTDQGAIPLPSFNAVNGTDFSKHIIVDVGAEFGIKSYWDDQLYWLLCGGKCIPRWNLVLGMLNMPLIGSETHKKLLYIHAPVDELRSSSFEVDSVKKWLAQASCFARIAEKLLPLLSEENQAILTKTVKEVEQVRKRSIAPAAKAEAIEAIFLRTGFYVPPQTQSGAEQTAAFSA